MKYNYTGSFFSYWNICVSLLSNLFLITRSLIVIFILSFIPVYSVLIVAHAAAARLQTSTYHTEISSVLPHSCQGSLTNTVLISSLNYSLIQSKYRNSIPAWAGNGITLIACFPKQVEQTTQIVQHICRGMHDILTHDITRSSWICNQNKQPQGKDWSHWTSVFQICANVSTPQELFRGCSWHGALPFFSVVVPSKEAYVPHITTDITTHKLDT
jgi:hypothetical protein